MKYMIGVDVGGTFTDFSVFEQESGRLFHFKHSSTNYDSSVAIVNGILEVLNMEHATAQQVVYLAHGTTVSTNALIEKGCKGRRHYHRRLQRHYGDRYPEASVYV